MPNPKGKYTLYSYEMYLFLHYGIFGLAILMSVLGAALHMRNTMQEIFSPLFIIFVLAAFILQNILQYQSWKIILEEAKKLKSFEAAIDSPGKAVGYQFIPFFNFYWFFVSFGKFGSQLTKLAKIKKKNIRISDDLGIAIAVLNICQLIPLLGILIFLVNYYILIPIFIVKSVGNARKLISYY